MTKEQLLDLLMLLSAIESWGFANQRRLPDYMADRLSDSVDLLRTHLLNPQ